MTSECLNSQLSHMHEKASMPLLEDDVDEIPVTYHTNQRCIAGAWFDSFLSAGSATGQRPDLVKRALTLLDDKVLGISNSATTSQPHDKAQIHRVRSL